MTCKFWKGFVRLLNKWQRQHRKFIRNGKPVKFNYSSPGIGTTSKPSSFSCGVFSLTGSQLFVGFFNFPWNFCPVFSFVSSIFYGIFPRFINFLWIFFPFYQFSNEIKSTKLAHFIVVQSIIKFNFQLNNGNEQTRPDEHEKNICQKLLGKTQKYK